MPNYCEGNLRIRGPYNKLKQFIEETFDGVQLINEKMAGFTDTSSAYKLELIKMRMYAKETCQGEKLERVLAAIDKKERLTLESAASVLKFVYDEKKNTQGYLMKDSYICDKAAYAEFSPTRFFSSRVDPSSHVIFFKMYQGWRIDGDYIVMLARKYELDMAIDSYESGCEIEGHVKVVNGQVVKNWWTEKHEDWDFDVPVPTAGF